ncbi:hypothetical protein Dimus_036657 [Dionaea muscipula]
MARNELGDVTRVATRMTFNCSLLCAEAEGIKVGILWAVDLGLNRVIVEIDAPLEWWTENCTICFVGREGNECAHGHRLAKWAARVNRFGDIEPHCIPDEVAMAIMVDGQSVNT